MSKLITFIILLLAISFNCYAQKSDEDVPQAARQAISDGYTHYKDSDFVGAAKEWEKALPLVQKYGGAYEFLLNALGSIYSENGDQQNLSRIMGLMDDHNMHELQKPCNEPECMSQRAQYYASKGDNAKAKESFFTAIAMPMSDSLKIKVYEDYGKFLGMNENDYASGADYLLSAADLMKKLHGVDEDYAMQMYNVGLFAFIGKKYEMSVDAHKAAADFYSRFTSPQAKKNVALNMKGMGNAYAALKNTAKAIECYKKLVDYYAQNDTANDEYPKAIFKLARQERLNKDYDVSIAHHKQAMQMFKQRGMSQDYSDAAFSLQLCYASAGKHDSVETNGQNAKDDQNAKLDKIINDELKNLDLTRNYLGKLTYAQSLGTIAGSYLLKEDYANSVDYFKQYVPTVRDAIRDEFRLRGENERMLVWNNQKVNIEDIKDLLLKFEGRHDALSSTFNGIAYDTELLSKGILLNSSIEFEKVLRSLGNEQLLKDYQQLKANEEKVAQLRSGSLTQVDLDNILKLERQNQELQLQLYRGCAEYADFTNYISYTWQDVQKELKDGDVAIEFVLAGDAESPFEDDRKMMALVLTNGAQAPEAVTIGNDSVWVKLQPWIAKAKRIFFSADGIFNRTAIEYLPYGGRPISEQFEIYRLSSTKELCYKHNAKPYTKAAIFGDINYNDESTMGDGTKRSLATMRGVGGETSFDDLSNTRREIDNINTILKQKGVADIMELRDTEASRNAFLGLDNSKVDILHIATHGMYKDDRKSTETDAMNNSVLAFAGANIDGTSLVTAADIAKMNLRQCDLAVLSACETGLGKLGDDGVFGLQRGFKNAGVHTLLMSLRSVYDNTTADMMISFYRYLMDGASKRDALIKAQKDIRDKGFTDPKYWATFILLDDI